MIRLATWLRRTSAALACTVLAVAIACGLCWLAGLPYELGTALPVAALVVMAWLNVFRAVWETAMRMTGGRHGEEPAPDFQDDEYAARVARGTGRE